MWISGEGEREVKISISSIRSAADGSGKELGTDLFNQRDEAVYL